MKPIPAPTLLRQMCRPGDSMIHLIAKVVKSRPCRSLLTLAFVGMFWAGWWLWPESPARLVRLSPPYTIVEGFTPGGRNVLLASSKYAQPKDGFRLASVDGLRPIIADELLPCDVAFDPTHTRLWAGPDEPRKGNQRIISIDVNRKPLHLQSTEQSQNWFRFVLWSADGTRVGFAGYIEPGITVFDSDTGQRVIERTDLARPWALSSDGRYLLATKFTYSNHETVVACDLSSGRDIYEIPVAPFVVREITLSTDGKTLVVNSSPAQELGRAIQVFDGQTGHLRGTLQVNASTWDGVTMSPCGRIVAVDQNDGSDRSVWDVSVSPPTCLDSQIGRPIRDVTFSKFAATMFIRRGLARESWELRDIATRDVIGRDVSNDDRSSPTENVRVEDERFATVTWANPPRLPNQFITIARKLFGWSFSDVTTTDVIDMRDGRTRHVAGHDGRLRKGADEIWTESDGSEPCYFVWPLAEPRPPWWLWLMTAFGAVVLGKTYLLKPDRGGGRI
jgi:WD40 repeat protein